MNYQQEVSGLLHQIREKGSSKEKRIHACQQLSQILAQCTYVHELGADWGSISSELFGVLTHRHGNSDVKKSIAEVISELLSLVPDDFERAVALVLSEYTKCHIRAEEERSLIVLCLKQAIERIYARNLWHLTPDAFEAVMKFVLEALKKNESHFVLSPVLDISLLVANLNFIVLDAHFEEFCDFLIGWIVDSVPQVITKCQSVFKELNRFWPNHMEYAQSLFEDFCNDATGFVQDYKKQCVSGNLNKGNATKHLSMAANIVSTMGDILAVFVECDIPFVVKTLSTVIDSYEGHAKALKAYYSVTVDKFFCSHCSVFAVAPKCSAYLSEKQWSTLIEIMRELFGRCRRNTYCVETVLDLYALIISNSSVPQESAEDLLQFVLSEKGIFGCYNLFRNPASVPLVIRFISSCLSPVDIRILQKAYLSVTSQLKQDVAILLDSPNRKDETLSSLRRREARILVLLKSLEKLALLKNSLIVMGVNPALLSFLCLEIAVSDEAFVTGFPAIHLTIVQLIFRHVELHDFYLVTSDWISRSMPGQSPTSRFAELQLNTIAKILKCGPRWKKTREVIVDWLYSLLSRISTSTMDKLLGLPEFRNCRIAARNFLATKHYSDRLKSCCTLLAAFDSITEIEEFNITKIIATEIIKNPASSSWNDVFSRDFIKFIMWYFERSISVDLPGLVPACCISVKDYKRKSSRLSVLVELLRGAPVESVYCNHLQSVSYNGSSMDLHQMKTLSLLLSAGDFILLMDFLLNRIPPSFNRNPSTDDLWIRSTIETIYATSSKDKNAAASDFVQKWRWALSQLAAYCVENRMRTPLGKPNETFAKIYAEFQRLMKEATANELNSPNRAFELASSSKNNEEDDEPYPQPRYLSPAEEWFRVRCLLEFLEILDKMIFNAHSGAIFQICNVQSLTRQFFVTNRKSCHEWYCRTFTSAIVVAFHNGFFAQAIRFGAFVLHDLEKRQKLLAAKATENGSAEVPVPPNIAFAVVCWVGRSMAELGFEQSTRGLRTWMKNIYGLECIWLNGIVHMAGARYEPALLHFRQSLNEERIPDTLKTLIRTMALDCLDRIRVPMLLDPQNCPAEMSFWTDAETLSGGSGSGCSIGDLARLQSLSRFGKVDSLPEKFPPWDISRALDRIEMQLSTTLRRTEVQEINSHLSDLGKLVLITDTCQRMHGRIATLSRISNVTLLKMNKKTHTNDVTDAIAETLDPSFLLRNTSNGDLGERLRHARKLNLWAERLAGPVAVHEETAILARKTKNNALAHHLLRNAAQTVTPAKSFAFANQLLNATEQIKMNWQMLHDEERVNHWASLYTSLQHSHGIVITQKLLSLQQVPMIDPGSISFDGIVANVVVPVNGYTTAPPPISPSSADFSTANDAISRASLTLVKYLKEDPSLELRLPGQLFCNPMLPIEQLRREMGYDLVGTLLTLASRSAPHLSKTRLQFAEWAYSVASGSNADKASFWNSCVGVPGMNDEHRKDLWDAICSSKSYSEFDSKYQNVTKTMPESTASLLTVNHSSSSLWAQLQKRRNFYHNVAISEYFTYLKLLGSDAKSGLGSVSATLRLLGLLVDFSDLVQPTMDSGMQHTNELLWIDILPQLFSRLSHPESAVRDIILRLLSKICHSSPHTIVFQVISGAASSAMVDVSDDVMGTEQEDAEETKKERGLMIGCCNQLESVLQERYPELARDVLSFVSELQKISLLYEERWTFVLANLEHEMSKRIEQIKIETANTLRYTHLDEKAKNHIIAEKTRLITSSVYRILTDLHERTCKQPPNTANEKTFVEQFGNDIASAFQISKTHSKNPEKAWAPFKYILDILNQKNGRRGTHTFNMADISPFLVKLKKSSIPVPGQEKKPFSEILTISGVSETTIVLPTKTKPKKMAFVSSDGKEQIFLFKGQEDLHLDERIMQLLHICNLMLSSSSKRSNPGYFARHYSVTPLGARCGLIQWVVGATPMFHIYRKWQMREAQLKNDGKTSGIGEIERPTDQYQKTLRSAFASHKVEPAIIADRSKWPVSVLKEVLQTLKSATPKDLLSRELWLRAGGGDTWWRVISRLARSSAVMSMVGAVLGLGDRHLDNVLVNLDHGHIVHIDYNICFDKGKNLRVPETVPFRLTQNFLWAMGPTQQEGTFRESCHHVLRSLREGREVLLTVLDAFVYDPLVDWTGSDHLTLSSAAVSVAVTLAVYGMDSRVAEAKPVAREMFAVRLMELSKPWLANCAELTQSLQNVKRVLEKLTKKSESVWDRAELLEQEKVEAGRQLKNTINAHHQMMTTFKPLLRALATCDERFEAYIRTYRIYFGEPLVRGHQALDAENSDFLTCISYFSTVLDNVNRIYHDLLNLDSKENAEPSPLSSVPSPLPSPKDKSSVPPPPGFEDFHKTPEQQEQNAHAKNVVRRVRSRLEGYLENAEPKRNVAVEEQADHWIQQATSTTLLSLMYEGWTAWV